MKAQQFATCCGIDIIDQFHGNPHTAVEYEMEDNPNGFPAKRKRFVDGKPVVKMTGLQQLQDILTKGHRPNWRDEWNTEDRCYVCVLTQEQLPFWMPTLAKLGFKFMCKWNNSTHQPGIRLLYMFAYPKQTSGRPGLPDPLEPPPGWNELQEAASNPQAEATKEAA